MRALLIFLLASFSLASCSLPGTQDESTAVTASDNTALYSDDHISLLVPKSWTGVARSELPSPRSGAIVVAYRSSEAKYGFLNNLLVMRDTLAGVMSSTKYSEVNHLQTTRNYLEYTKIRDEAFTFSDGEPSRLYIFEARYNETTSRMKFVQTARTCGSVVYLLHVSLTLEKNPDNYAELLRTFTCK
jgi:hypothetical protein